MIGQLFNTLLYIMLFADVLERRYPEEFKRIAIELTYNFIYAFSRLQIFFGQANTYINKYIETNPTIARIKDNINSFLKQDCKIREEYIKNGKSFVRTIVDDYDFIIITSNNKAGLIYKKIIYKEDKDKNNNNNELKEESDIKFMLLEIQLGENAYKIDLKTTEFNYYLVGNKFTKEFFIYYLREYSKVKAEINETTKISLKLIDHNVNSIHIDFTDNNEYIELEKNGYKTSIINKLADIVENNEIIEENVIVEDNLDN